MEQSGNIPILNIPRTSFGSIPQIFIVNFFRIFWNYIMGMFHECSTNNVLGTLFGNILRNFIRNFFRIFWEYILEMFHEYSTNIYLPGGIWITFDQVSYFTRRHRSIKNTKISVTSFPCS